VFNGFLWWVQAVHPVPYGIFGREMLRGLLQGTVSKETFAMCTAEPHIEVLELVSLYFGN
jgi:hypothetical protein